MSTNDPKQQQKFIEQVERMQRELGKKDKHPGFPPGSTLTRDNKYVYAPEPRLSEDTDCGYVEVDCSWRRSKRFFGHKVGVKWQQGTPTGDSAMSDYIVDYLNDREELIDAIVGLELKIDLIGSCDEEWMIFPNGWSGMAEWSPADFELITLFADTLLARPLPVDLIDGLD